MKSCGELTLGGSCPGKEQEPKRRTTPQFTASLYKRISSDCGNLISHTMVGVRRVTQLLKDSFYVDDCVSSLPTEEEVSQFQEESTGLLQEAGMDLKNGAQTVEQFVPQSRKSVAWRNCLACIGIARPTRCLSVHLQLQS